MNSLLKFITCGSVDDGKSTLIGHILYDTKLLYADQEKALELDSRVGSRGGKIDYSLLLDGLMAEREQGITIDVAYRYFTTKKRSFIVADTPGHEEYTRNMAVGASFADLAVILIDATKGVLAQTRRHTRICSFMGIRQFVFAVNKMDLAGYSRETFDSIAGQVRDLCGSLGLENIQIIPISATEGENVTRRSALMDWYAGPPLLEWLETVQVDGLSEEGFYMPVQRVCRPDHTFRGFQGQIEAGSVCAGDRITVLPGGEEASVEAVYVGCREVKEAVRGQPAMLRLTREVDISRGCVLVKDTDIQVTSVFDATLLWMQSGILTSGRDFLAKIGTRLIPCKVSEILYTVDVNTGDHRRPVFMQKNEIARCRLELSSPVVLDLFSRHHTLGELILIDRVTNATSACGVIEEIRESEENQKQGITPQVRARKLGQTPYIILAQTPEEAAGFEEELITQGLHTMAVVFTKDKDADRAVFAVDILRQAGLITVVACPRGQTGLEERLRELAPASPAGRILDLRPGGPEEDRLMYENTVNYVFS
ncbi:MAG: sulfate adenylyltransferase [Lachnospiraceae bacterium]|nr:sulfate adenylyltransferase [Lachnospiraceae bacterium]